MNIIFKFFLLLTLTIFSTPIFAGDGEDITIRVDDAPTVHEDSGTMSFEIKLNDTPDWCTDVTVNYTTVEGSAKEGSDYTQKSGSVVFKGACVIPLFGEDTKTITIDITDTPTSYESTESFYLHISNSTVGYTVIRDQGEGAILDNNPPPLELTLHDRSENERDSNWTLNFTARLNHPAPAGGVTVHYTTEDNTAIAGNDYISTTDSVFIPENNTDGIIPVTIIGDTIPEPTINETFKVKITSISQGTVVRDTATGTIKDDDRVKVDISSSDVTEGNSGDNNKMEFKIFLAKDYPNIAPLTINYTTQDGSNPSATISNNDYTQTNGSVTFNVGDREKIIYVPIIGDDTIEPDENLKMFISGSDLIIDDSSESEIINDDGDYPGVDFSTGDLSIIEGNSSSKILNFTFTLDADALADSSFDYYTQDDEATVADGDYVKVDTKTYNIPVGTREITIPITINGDTKIEEDESFYIKFINENNIVIHGHTAKAHIINDDGVYPNLSFDVPSYSIIEGDVGQSDLNFTLTLDAPAFEGSSFDYYTQDNTAKLSDSDYEKIERKTYHIATGDTKIIIPVKINGDKNIEGDESFYLKIDNELNMTISGTQSPRGIITNDDGDLPSFSIEVISPTEGTEGDSGSKYFQFIIKLDKNVTEDGVSIQYRTVNGTAKTEDNDYKEIAINTVLFAIGESNKTFSVELFGDTKVEDNETFTIEILNPHRATISDNQLEITILNDDLHNSDPFECKDNDMYISSSTNRETGATGKMWLHRVDTKQNPFQFQVLEANGADEIYNATAYNPDDNYIYGLYNRELLKLSKTGKVIDLGKITALPDRFEDKQLYAGAIYNGFYYVAGRRNKQKELFKINLADKNVSTITLSLAVLLKDFAFSPDGKYLYGIEKDGKLTQIEVSNGDTTQIGDNHNGYIFDSTFSDKNGRLFANDGEGAGFFEFDITTGAKQFLSNSQPASYNDGANCLNASLVFNDYGDAPESYGMARHDIRNGIFMGSEVDHDITPYYSINADGDDNNGIDDEDGVTFVNGADINNSYFEANQTQELNITVSKDGFLNVWLDFGIDGSFTTVGDKVISSMALTAGTHTISFFIPSTVTKNQLTYIRFRYSSIANLNPSQNAVDGEVEDYAIKFKRQLNGVKGRFNIQRTNSALNAKDFALYTQIVGRDFDYHVVFYDENLTSEKQLTNVPVKIDIIDAISNINLYTAYYYFSPDAPSSRIIVQNSSDLNTLPATKEALFLITYPTKATGLIMQTECGADYKTCFETLIASSESNRTDEAEDKFAIRPESFYITIADGNQERLNSRHPTEKTIKLASGYEYNLTLIATKWESLEPSLGYNKDFNSSFDFNMTGLTSCANTSPIIQPISYRDGIENIPNFKHDNVGHYKLTQATDENWTTIDQANNDCIANSAITSANGDSKSGCNIKLQIQPIDLEFYPDHFSVDLNMSNLPSSGHSDFIYMSEINTTYSDVAIAFQGAITAQSENNTTTTNFTTGCVATNLLLDLNSTTVSVEGINQNIETTEGTDVNFTRLIRFNSTSTTPTLELNQTLNRINRVVAINSDKFLNENNGTVTLDMRYNLNKNLTEPINPVEVRFHKISVNSTDANSIAHDKTNITSNIYTPRGEKAFTNNRKNFYFARVVSDLNNYPRVNLNISHVVRTPLNVDIFCKTTINNYCADREVLNNTNLAGTTREQIGWYLSIKHNSNLDGNVTNLNATPNIVNIIPSTTTNPITLTNGKNGLIMEKFIDCTSPKSTIKITTSPALRFEPSQYIVNCTDQNPSQWTGVGKTGNILKIKPNINGSGKMDW